MNFHKWQWTDDRWNKLSSADLIEIQSLSQTKVHQLNQYSLQFLDQSGLKKSLFEHIEQIGSAVIEEVKTQKWLINRFSNLSQSIIVSWDNNLSTFAK